MESAGATSEVELPLQFLEAFEGALEVLDDVVGEGFGGGNTVKVGESLVLDPAHFKTRSILQST